MISQTLRRLSLYIHIFFMDVCVSMRVCVCVCVCVYTYIIYIFKMISITDFFLHDQQNRGKKFLLEDNLAYEY